MTSPMRKSFGTRGFATVATAGALALAACGSSSGSTDAPTTAAAPATEAAAPVTEAAAPATDAAAPAIEAEVPATEPAAPSNEGKTIKVGLVNQDSGPVPFPDFRAGAEVAIKNINDNGGINGAMLEVVSCATSLSPESSINCATQMVEEGVVLAYTGADFTAEASLPVYTEAGLPHLTTVGWGPSLERSPGSHILGSANAATAVGTFALMQDLKLTKVALAHDAVPAAIAFAQDTAAPLAKSMGIELQLIPIDPAAPDLAAVVATAQAGGAEVFWGVQSEPGCVALVTAAQAANFDGPIVAGSCTDYIKAIGDSTVGTYSILTQLVPDTGGGSSADIAKRLTDFEKLMADAGQEKLISSNSVAAFGAWTELATVLSGIDGDVTTESVEAALSADATIPGWFRPDVNCGAKAWPDVAAYCSAQVSVWEVEKKADGSLGRKVTIDFFDSYKRSTGN
jgi:branched-chain amino acid transport system substrate-binding protein